MLKFNKHKIGVKQCISFCAQRFVHNFQLKPASQLYVKNCRPVSLLPIDSSTEMLTDGSKMTVTMYRGLV